MTWDVIVKITIRERDSLVLVGIIVCQPLTCHANATCSVVACDMGCHCQDNYQGEGLTCIGRYNVHQPLTY